MASNAKNLAELLNQDTTVAVGDIADGSVTTAKLAADAVTAAKLADDSVVTANIVDGNVTAVKTTGVGKGKNIIINGDMRIAQRGTAAVTTSGAFTVDRWKNISNANDFSAQQSSTVPSGQGFYKSIYITPTSTKSPGSGTYFFTSHYIEGFNIGQLGWGTSGARTVTLSFWVRSSKTGIYTVGLKNADATRSRQQEYTISSANTWEKKTITITGETSGSWPIDNTRGLALDFCLAGNASATSTLGSWISANSNMSTNQVNFFDSTSNQFYLTGVQLELGTQATDFEHRSHGEEHINCCRYFQQFFPDPAGTAQIQCIGLTNTHGHFQWWPTTEMRVRPTVGTYDNTIYWESHPWNAAGTSLTISSISNGHLGRGGGEIAIYGTWNPALVRGDNFTVDGENFYWDAEL